MANQWVDLLVMSNIYEVHVHEYYIASRRILTDYANTYVSMFCFRNYLTMPLIRSYIEVNGSTGGYCSYYSVSDSISTPCVA